MENCRVFGHKRNLFDPHCLIDIVLSWSLSDILNKNLYKFQVEKLPLTFSSTTHYASSFIYLFLEETRAALHSQLVGISQAPASHFHRLERNLVDVDDDQNDLKCYIMTLTDMIYVPKVGDLIAFTQDVPTSYHDLDRPNSPFLPAFVTSVITVSKFIQVQLLLPDPTQSNSSTVTNELSQVYFFVHLTNFTTNIRIWQALDPSSGNLNIIERTLSITYSYDVETCRQCRRMEGEKGVIDLELKQSFECLKLNSSQESAVLSCLDVAGKKCLQHNCFKFIWGPPGTGKTKTIASLLFLLLKTKRRTLTCAPTNIAVVGVVKRLLSLVRDPGLECDDTCRIGDIVLFGNKERLIVNHEDHKELHEVFLDYRIKVLSDSLSMWKTSVNEVIRFLKNLNGMYIQEDDMNTCNVLGKKLTSCIRSLHTHLPTSVLSIDIATKMDHFIDLFQKVDECLKKMVITRNESRYVTTKCLQTVKDLQEASHKHSIVKFLSDYTMWEAAVNKVTLFLKSLDGRHVEESAINTCNGLGKKLISCTSSLQSHLSTPLLSSDFATKIHHFVDLFQKVDESLKEIVITRDESCAIVTECLQELIDLQAASCIWHYERRDQIEYLCLSNACLVFCTASSSMKLCRNFMKPIELVLIDEAAQLRECEALIPLQVRGVRHVVLVGDEKQLPSMLHSKISEDAKFGRSLFERLVLLGHQKHLLNVQYRMHPSISQFPNTEFYNGWLLDGPNVINKAHKKQFLEGDMYGSYSFINVDSSKEELDKNNSMKNMVEVAVIAKIVANLFKECVAKKLRVTVGCLSPYKAQVEAIQAKLNSKLDNQEAQGVTVNVRSIDGSQGGEEDVIIFSTVRFNSNGSVGFLSNRQRANVALTRAKHCLWIVGNKETMIKSGSVWNKLVLDAENRGCVYNASDDKNLAQAMVQEMVESALFYSLMKSDSLLFKEAKWKVEFSETFIKRIARITNLNVRKLVVSLLVKLSSGWRQVDKKNQRRNNDTLGFSNMFETYNIDGPLYLVWSVDVVYENSQCVQVLMFWDILPSYQIRENAKYLERVFKSYSLDEINRCRAKRYERNHVFPMSWPMDSVHDLN